MPLAEASHPAANDRKPPLATPPNYERCGDDRELVTCPAYHQGQVGKSGERCRPGILSAEPVKVAELAFVTTQNQG